MTDAIGIRIDQNFLKKIEQLSKEESVDRSTMIRKLAVKGYQEIMKEKAVNDYREEKITFSEAAHRSGLTLWEMSKYLVEKGIHSSYSWEDVTEEIQFLATEHKNTS